MPRTGESRWRRSDAQLRRGDRHLARAPVALEADLDAAPDQVADERTLEIADAGDRPSVESEDHVTGSDARRGCRRAIEQLDNLEARRPPELRGEGRSQAAGAADDPQIRASDTAVAHQRAEDRPRRRVD